MSLYDFDHDGNGWTNTGKSRLIPNPYYSWFMPWRPKVLTQELFEKTVPYGEPGTETRWERRLLLWVADWNGRRVAESAD